VHELVALLSRSVDLPRRVAILAELLTLHVAAFVAATARARATGSVDDGFADGSALFETLFATVFGLMHHLVALLSSSIDLARVMAVRTECLALGVAARVMVVVGVVVSTRKREADDGESEAGKD
jgi:hypothetical protein